jgi:hypothetical protein
MTRRTSASSGRAAISCDDGAWLFSAMKPMDLPCRRPALTSEKVVSGSQQSSAQSAGRGRVVRLGLDADERAVLDALAPQRAADRRPPVGVLESHQRVELEVGVVHAAADDDLVVAVDLLGADPRHVGALAVEQLGRRLGDDGVFEGAVLGGQRLEDAFELEGLAVLHRQAEGAFGGAVVLLEVGHGSTRRKGNHHDGADGNTEKATRGRAGGAMV